ncbi:MAG: hypothetical protein UIC65_05330 [Alphaproteobacteria bacterium]|nr:hypothetical protein [Alphaproteobacteria bacterium]
MKTISKILYGLISFSVFAAYKIETAWAGWHVKLVEYASKCGSVTSVASDILVKDTRFKLRDRTVCQAGQFLYSCGSADSTVYTNMDYERPDKETLESLAYSCRDYYACEGSCKSGTSVAGMPDTILKVPENGYTDVEYDVEICDTDTLTELFRVAQYGMTDADFLVKSGDAILLAPLPGDAEPMMQKYEIWFEADASDWVSMNDESFCYQAAGITDSDSGTFQRDKNCPFIYS